MGGHGRGSSARDGSAAAASDAPGASGAGPSDSDVNMDHDNNDNDDNDYEGDTLEGEDNDDDDDNDDGLQGEAATPLEDENLRQVHLLAGVVCTNQDHGLGPMLPLLDSSAAVPATFEAVKLQAHTFFASRLLVCAGGFLEENLRICFCCLRWNLTAPFKQCDCDGWTGCGFCSYI